MGTSEPDELIEALASHDAAHRAKRAERSRWVGQHEVGGMVIGYFLVLGLLREARACFINGHDFAALLVAAAAVEHLISEELVDRQLTAYGTSFEQAIRVARTHATFPSELLDRADRLRLLRNPFAHPKPPGHQHSLGTRYVSQRRHPDLIAEEDARFALAAMFDLFNHTLKRA